MSRQRYDAVEGTGKRISVFRIHLGSGGVLTVETPGVPLSEAQKTEVASELHELADTIRTAGDVK